MFTATKKQRGNMVWFSFAVSQRRVTCYYFYVWDDDFGPAFVKVCAYFPYPMKIWLNGHEWAKRQAAKAGIGFAELSNGFATCDRSGRAAGDLRPARPGHDRGVRRTVVVDPAAAAHRDTTAPPATGGSCRCDRSRRHAPWCSTHRDGPAGSSRPWSPTTSTSVARSGSS